MGTILTGVPDLSVKICRQKTDLREMQRQKMWRTCAAKEKRTRRWKAAVVTMSDKGFAGEREDKSGPLICEMIADQGYDVVRTGTSPG